MRYTSEKDNAFASVKLFQAVLYTDDLKFFLDALEEQGIEFLTAEGMSVAEYVFELLTKTFKMSEHNIRNLLDFANYCRFHKKADEARAEIFESCNNIIHLAKQIEAYRDDQCFFQMIKVRCQTLRQRYRMMYHYIMDPKNTELAIRWAIEMDFAIICTHSELYDDEEFKTAVLDMVGDPTYINCIENLLRENSGLFHDRGFLTRVLQVLSMNEKMMVAANSQDDNDSEDVLTNKEFIKQNMALKSKLSVKKGS